MKMFPKNKIFGLTTVEPETGLGATLFLTLLEALLVFFSVTSSPFSLLLKVASRLSNSLAYSEYFVVLAAGGRVVVGEGLPAEAEFEELADEEADPRLRLPTLPAGVTGLELEKVAGGGVGVLTTGFLVDP